jgi:hypothetical protein
MGYVDAAKWLAAYGLLAHVFEGFVGKIPLMGSSLLCVNHFAAMVVGAIGLYKIYKLLPEKKRNRIEKFVAEKTKAHLPMLSSVVALKEKGKASEENF